MLSAISQAQPARLRLLRLLLLEGCTHAAGRVSELKVLEQIKAWMHLHLLLI